MVGDIFLRHLRPPPPPHIKSRAVNPDLCLLQIQNETIFVTIPLLTAKIGRSPNLAIITVHFGWDNNLVCLIFTFLFSTSIQKLFFKFHFTDLRHDS